MRSELRVDERERGYQQGHEHSSHSEHRCKALELRRTDAYEIRHAGSLRDDASLAARRTTSPTFTHSFSVIFSALRFEHCMANA
ncbi:hypothetical protein J7T55_010947 [Diaporthe amygdali]|uniref:uncharacterized protein n=1 Tax=Phomopsis amygdali TaxID=1214568 RepID=UPI0022FDEA19|nr:uncharacterized protein J7T55_010947 [Diaporthe amygdali]KAJ0100676.1 hypothetical protein J7T55_010947 [Diaporthe amygdali]